MFQKSSNKLLAVIHKNTALNRSIFALIRQISNNWRSSIVYVLNNKLIQLFTWKHIEFGALWNTHSCFILFSQGVQVIEAPHYDFVHMYQCFGSLCALLFQAISFEIGVNNDSGQKPQKYHSIKPSFKLHKRPVNAEKTVKNKPTFVFRNAYQNKILTASRTIQLNVGSSQAIML